MALPASIPNVWQRLATFVHISDLHIGEISPARGDATVSAVMARIHASGQSFLDGTLGHHGNALQALADFVDRLRDEDEGDFDLVVTGDLTRTGGTTEFQNADSFLYGAVDINQPLGNYVGLRLRRFLPFLIPGNHDHWDGEFIPWGAWPTRYPAYFPAPLPRIETTRRLRNGRYIAFSLINSDADVSPFGHERPLALGSFSSDLRHQGAQFAPVQLPDEIRVMLIHHSWYQMGNTLRMRSASRRDLERYLVHHNVKAILTGHSHGPFLDHFTINPEQFDVYELRAGTATQLDETPVEWKPVWGTLPARKWEANSLLVHRLFESADNRTYWHVQAYRRSKNTGFEELKTPDSSRCFEV